MYRNRFLEYIRKYRRALKKKLQSQSGGTLRQKPNSILKHLCLEPIFCCPLRIVVGTFYPRYWQEEGKALKRRKDEGSFNACFFVCIYQPSALVHTTTLVYYTDKLFLLCLIIRTMGRILTYMPLLSQNMMMPIVLMLCKYNSCIIFSVHIFDVFFVLQVIQGSSQSLKIWLKSII